MKQDFTKLILAMLAASGLWKVMELLLQLGIQKRLKKAEIRNLNVQANDLVASNWIKWSEKMEQRISELESKNTQMNETITKQRERINTLQKYVDQLEEEIRIYKPQ